MKVRFLVAWGLGFLVLASGASSARAACNKTCLLDVTEEYLEAMVRGDVDRLALSDKIKSTSNSQNVSLGEGDTWQPGITVVNRYTFVDPATRTSIFFGTIAGNPAEDRVWWHYAVRLTLDKNGDLVEIEEQSTRGGFQTANRVEVPFKEAAIFDAVLPKDEQANEDDLIRVADLYWSALSSGEIEGPLFSPDCQRTEFGTYSTNNPVTHDERKPDHIEKAKVGKSCRWFFDFGPKFHWPTDNRRYYIVDVPRGVVVGIGQLHQAGEEGIPGITLIEAFKIVSGRIEFLWAPALDWGTEESGWPDWSRAGIVTSD